MRRHVAALEEEPLLRVHRRRLGGRDAKGAPVEALRARDEAAVRRALPLRLGERAHLPDQLARPARRRDAAEGVPARALEPPADGASVAASWPVSDRPVQGQRHA